MYFVVFLLYFAGIEADGEIAITTITTTPPATTTIPICCPIGWTLVKLHRGLFRASKYQCITPTASDQKKPNEIIEFYEDIAPVYGYGIEKPPQSTNNTSNVDDGLPHCDRQSLVFFAGEEDVEITSRSCLTKINGKLAALSCPSTHNETIQILSFVKKCCPLNYVYDASQRKCTQVNDRNFDNYHSIFHHSNSAPDVAVFIDDTLNCPRDKASVEYNLRVKQFQFVGGQLLLPKLGKRFKISDYCIEAITSESTSSFSFTNSTTPDDQLIQFLVRTCDDVSICDSLPCIRRCCTDGEMFTKGNATSYCKKDESDISYHSFESLEISGNFTKPPVFGILRSLDCLKFRLDPDSYADEAHTINTRDGSLYVSTTQKIYTINQYCIEKVRNSTWGDQKLYTFLCFDSKVVGNDRIRFRLYPIGLLISCIFYAITLLVYLSISRLRNLPGKILICLVCSLFVAYLAIAIGQLSPTPNDDICFASGFFIYFCLMAAFAWMNVMCFDIWQTFGSAKKSQGFKGNQTKRFVLYSMYGWGIPTLLTVITVSLTKSGLLSENIRPHFGHGRCWFTYDSFGRACLIFFSGPVGILFIINFVLFALTLSYCNRVKREIFRMQSSNMEKPMLRRRFFMDKARFTMNTKLFIVMGITWFMELLSIAFYDHKNIFFWVISDSFNVLLGVFVFLIFVFKKRVWHTILEKLGLRSKENSKLAPKSTFNTQSSCAQSVSMTRLNVIDGNTTLLSPSNKRRM